MSSRRDITSHPSLREDSAPSEPALDFRKGIRDGHRAAMGASGRPRNRVQITQDLLLLVLGEMVTKAASTVAGQGCKYLVGCAEKT